MSRAAGNGNGASPGAALGLLAAGLGASLMARAITLLPAGDPLHSTLVVLPFLVAAFLALEGAAAGRGARRLPAAARSEALALGMLVLFALIRPHLGLPERSAHLLAAGFLLVLAHRLGHQVLALRPLLGERLTFRGPPWPFFVLPLLAYLAILPWSAAHHPPDGDEPFYLLMTHSLAWDLDVDLTDDYADGDWRHFMDRPIEPQPGDPVGPQGQLYSRHNMLLPLVLALPYRLAGLAGALVVMAMLAAALAWATLRLAVHYVPEHPGEALLAWALVAFASPVVLYAYQVWVEVPAALLAMISLDQILRLEGGPAAGWRRRQWLGIGLPILLLPLVKLRFMLMAGPLLMLAWWYSGRPKKALILLAVALAAVGGGLLVHNQLVYDNPLKIHTWQELELHRYQPGDFAEGAVGLFWDSAFGLFTAMPLWLLLIPATVPILRRRPSVVVHLAILTLPYLAVVVPRPEWYGGWSPPFRYALVCLPLLGLALVPLLAERRRSGARALVAALGAATLALLLLWLTVPGWTYNFADGRTDLLDHLSVDLGADVARLFPSTVRPRLASWLWPLATLLLVPLVWHWPWQALRRRWPRWERAAHLPRPRLAGVAGLLALLALMPLAAERLPTGVVELEDPWVPRTGGALYPDQWSIERTRYRGGWLLHRGERLEVPVVPGGDRVTLELHAFYVENEPSPFPVEVRAGDRVLTTWRPGPEDDRLWRTIEVGPVPWPAGEPLVIEPVARPGPYNGVIFDRVHFDWR